MSGLGRLLGSAAAALALAAGSPASLAAQGVTTAALRGTITREAGGTAVEGAVVTLTNTAKGTSFRAVSQTGGRYNFENVEPGTYSVEVRAIGFEAASKTGIVLTLGQRYTQDFTMRAQVVVLQELEVTATTDPLLNAARTGAAQIVSDTSIHRLPLLGRNFTSLLSGSPQVTITSQGGPSIAGQNNRFNTILIDGSINNDLFGLASGGTPGGQANVKPLSLEAIQEFQVLSAPFDVRQGNFAGGLINAVTKSGTNEWHGSVFGYFQNRDLVGKDTANNRFAEFNIKQFGGSVGGPIIRDRMHLFAAVDKQSREQPFVGVAVTDASIGIPAELADRVTNAIRSQFGFDPGTFAEPINETPNLNVFGKLTYQASTSHYLELSHNYVDGFDDQFSRSTRNRNNRDGFQLSNSGYQQNNTTNTTRLKWLGQFGRISTEAIAAYQTVRDFREMPNIVPLFIVGGNITNNSFIAAGGERFSHDNKLDQDIAEVTLNATLNLGNHQVTVGTHNEIFSFFNVFWQNRYGVWTYDNVTALEAGTPSQYEILLANQTSPIADWGTTQVGFYAQDQWSPTPRLTLTGGVRIDVPFMDSPVENPTLTSSQLAINTGVFPSGNALISPRFGFNYDLFGTGNTILRGGVGIFSGRPPYVWMSNAFTGTGLEAVTLTCTGAAVPTPTANIDNLPTQCSTGGPPTPPAASIVAFDKDFRFQQSLRYALGVDHKLPGGVVATVDFLHTQSKNTMYISDVNLVPQAVNGEGRQMYGTISASSSSTTPTRVTTSFLDVLVHTNKNEDRATLVTGQLAKRFGSNIEFNAAYTWARSKDLITLGSSIAFSNFQNTVLNGTLADRTLTTGALDVPHRISIGGTANLPQEFYVSLSYSGRAGRPYTYIVSGDANADGISSNDAIYVPRDASDISLTNAADWSRLNLWLVGEECILDQRGRIMERNSCRNPWVHFIDLRVGKRVKTLRGQQVEITADAFNLLNLLNDDWGLNRSNFGQSTEFEQRVAPLTLAGFDNRGTADPADDRPRYSVPSSVPTRDQVVVNSSRWRVQLGLKYVW